nr:helix-turn-helix transcriptional regulator [uncultured Butyrivibrio sp.]
MVRLNLELRREVGKRLRKARTDKKLTQREVSTEVSKSIGAEFSPCTLSNYEKGRREPSMSILVLLARIYETTTDKLLGR